MRIARATRRAVVPAASLAACLLVAAIPKARADIALQVEFENTTLHLMEPINVIVTISNSGPDTVTLDPIRRKDAAYLEIKARQVDGRSADPIALRPAPVVGRIPPGLSRSFLINLHEMGNFSEGGGYNVDATIVSQGIRFQTRPIHIQVISGLPIKKVTRVSPISPSALRTYSLSYLSRGGREVLFLSVDENPTKLNYGVFVLGSLVRVFEPVLEVDSAGTVTVIHQIDPRQYARTLLETTKSGVRLIDQSYERLKGRVGAKGNWELPPENSATPTTTPPTSR